MATQYRATRPLYRSLKKGGKGMKVALWNPGDICTGLTPKAAKLLEAKGWVEAVAARDADAEEVSGDA